MSTEKPRQIAARVLARWESGTDYAENLLLEETAQSNLTPQDRALVQELVFGSLRWRSTLDWLISRKTQGRVQKMPLQILLRLGLYQMFWLNRIPDHAAVHESVQAAREAGFGPQSGFINAVLRGYGRERDETRHALEELQSSDPAVGFSHPAWLCQRWQNRWSADHFRQLLVWNNAAPSTWARINTLKTNAAALQKIWDEEGVRARARAWDWTGDLTWELLSHPPLTTLPSFQQGLFYIQDPSTLLAVRMLDPRPGEAILDACAAPGGKTTFIAQLMNNKGYIMAQDLEIQRRQLIRENCDRLGVTCVQISRATTTINPDLSEPFDRILIDAPCSNSGVMRRRVDLRWRMRAEELVRLQRVQLELLESCAPQLGPGGILVYSTCSLEPEENQAVIAAFLKKNPDFTLEAQRELLPFADDTDGGFVARLKRGSGVTSP